MLFHLLYKLPDLRALNLRKIRKRRKYSCKTVNKGNFQEYKSSVRELEQEKNNLLLEIQQLTAMLAEIDKNKKEDSNGG